jgi:hypothetical protein
VITKERFSFPGGSRFHFRDIPVEMSSHAGTPSSVSAWSTSSKATRMESPPMMMAGFLVVPGVAAD